MQGLSESLTSRTSQGKLKQPFILTKSLHTHLHNGLWRLFAVLGILILDSAYNIVRNLFKRYALELLLHRKLSIVKCRFKRSLYVTADIAIRIRLLVNSE